MTDLFDADVLAGVMPEGKVDAVRLPKPAYYVYRVMQSEQPDLHIIGHWSYPSNTVKTVYVAANHCQAVELFVNGKSLGFGEQSSRFLYTWKEVRFLPGSGAPPTLYDLSATVPSGARKSRPTRSEAQTTSVNGPGQ